MDLILSFITKNSFSKLKNSPITLFDVLASTKQLPYKTLILVDDSKDETVKTFKKWCEKEDKELVLVKGAGTRAIARQKAIEGFLESFKNEWLMFVDDDCILNRGWWNEAREYANESNVGLIWGLNYDSSRERFEFLKLLGVDYVDYMIKQFYARGGMHDTMLKRKVIEDIELPEELHVFEDWYILKHVQSKGFDVKIVKVGITHYNPWIEFPSGEIKEMARLAKKYGVERSDWSCLLRSVAGVPLNVYIGVKVYGWKKGLKRGFIRSKTKIGYRWHLLRG